METTENNLEMAPQPHLIITEQAQHYLRKAGQWASFLGVMGFIGTAFIALAALSVGTMITAMAKINPLMGAAAGMGGVLTVVYLLLALLSFFFALYLYQFGGRIKKGVAYQSTEEITLAAAKLKSFFKLWGIVTIVYLVFLVLFIALMMVIGVGAASMQNNGSIR